jgi:hypothetical protein
MTAETVSNPGSGQGVNGVDRMPAHLNLRADGRRLVPRPRSIVRAFGERRAYEAITRRLPPELAAFLDRYYPGDVNPWWSGPLNGQPRRQELVEALLTRCSFAAIIETGTFRGATTEWLARFGLPVFTVELDPHYYAYARWRLRKYSNVTVLPGDSAAGIRSINEGEGSRIAGPVFAYLDAHGPGHLPLLEEVDAVRDGWDDWVAVVDDFEVPDDAGYRFEEYGPGLRMSLELLRLDERPDVRVFWPAARSDEEAGSRKGCVILAAGAMRERLAEFELLRLQRGDPHEPRA